MKVKNIIGYAIKDGKKEWWFELTWGDGHGYMWAILYGQEYKHSGGIGGTGNKIRIDLNDYDIKFNFKENNMILTKEQKKEMEKAVKPAMEFLSNFHPHCKIIIDSVCSEFVEGAASFRTEEFIKD